jgi:hypothetical protein
MRARAGNQLEPGALIVMAYEQTERRTRTAEERAALLEQRRRDAEVALIERQKADDEFRANYERLKAERLAREAAAAKDE